MHKVLRASINICGSNIEEKSHNKAFRKEKKRREEKKTAIKPKHQTKKREEKSFFVFVFKNKIFEFYGNPSSPNKLYPTILPLTRF